MQKLFRIEGSSIMGDKVEVRLPLEAVRKIIRVTGKLPVPEKNIGRDDMKELMDAIEKCLEGDMDGDMISIRTAEGMNLRIYIEER